MISTPLLQGYMESYPGNCYDGDTTGWDRYMRKHNPFMGFENIRKNPKRCANIVNAEQLYADLDNNAVCVLACLKSAISSVLMSNIRHQLPNFSYYTPNMDNDAHDTNITYAGEFVIKFMMPLISNPNFFENTLVVITWDEDDYTEFNRVCTILLGSVVKSGNKDGTPYVMCFGG
jgi:hypothetical protein